MSSMVSVTRKGPNLFKNVEWGTFKDQLKDYNTKHKTNKKKNLRSFSNYIAKHPSKFHSITRKRASFYKNVINSKHKKAASAKNNKNELSIA